MAKIRADDDQCVVHVESAERGVCPLPCWSLPIGVNHPWNAELVFRIVPAERHYDIRRMVVLNHRLLHDERSLQRLSSENNSGKIRLLQKFNQTARQRRVV